MDNFEKYQEVLKAAQPAQELADRLFAGTDRKAAVHVSLGQMSYAECKAKGIPVE
jgi:hypothetical protein